MNCHECPSIRAATFRVSIVRIDICRVGQETPYVVPAPLPRWRQARRGSLHQRSHTGVFGYIRPGATGHKQPDYVAVLFGDRTRGVPGAGAAPLAHGSSAGGSPARNIGEYGACTPGRAAGRGCIVAHTVGQAFELVISGWKAGATRGPQPLGNTDRHRRAGWDLQSPHEPAGTPPLKRREIAD